MVYGQSGIHITRTGSFACHKTEFFLMYSKKSTAGREHPLSAALLWRETDPQVVFIIEAFPRVCFVCRYSFSGI